MIYKLQTHIILLVIFFGAAHLSAQPVLNTAARCGYMKPTEREMIAEINLVRNNPPGYVAFLQPLLKAAQEKLDHEGKGNANYSITYTTTYPNGQRSVKTDTVWHYTNEEEVKAIESLIADLKGLQPLRILQPDRGIYKAVTFFAADQARHQWGLMHTGSDGSGPRDRIRRFSPSMRHGNENIAGRFPLPTPRQIVIQLLIDSGIPGYGHRYNLLDPAWTHVACFDGGLSGSMYRWIQNFGQKGLRSE
jgi:uncharacterized protein YkwD